MNEKEFTQKMKTALEHSAPDDFQGILAEIEKQESMCETQMTSVENNGSQVVPFRDSSRRIAENGKKNRRRYRLWPTLVAACLCLVIGVGYLTLEPSRQTVTAAEYTITLENQISSVELQVSKEETIISCTALNEETEAILKNLATDVTGMDMQEAIDTLLLAFENMEDAEASREVTVSVQGENIQKGEKLQETIEEQIHTHMEEQKMADENIDQGENHSSGFESPNPSQSDQHDQNADGMSESQKEDESPYVQEYQTEEGADSEKTEDGMMGQQPQNAGENTAEQSQTEPKQSNQNPEGSQTNFVSGSAGEMNFAPK